MISATLWLEALEGRMAAVQKDGGEDDVHQLRVATRRLSSWLKLGRVSILRSDLRWMRAAGGAVRDVDIALGQAPPETLTAWLQAERGRRLAHLVQIVAAPRAAALCAALAYMPPVAEARAREALPRLARAVLEEGDEFARAPNDVERFHQLRRSVRGLRYALEWLDEKTNAFKEFQDLSGRGADLSGALLIVDLYPEADELDGYRGQLETEFAARRIDAVGAWPGLRGVVETFADHAPARED